MGAGGPLFNETYHQALQWVEGRRDTTVVRKLVEEQLSAGSVECVWTARNLARTRYDIDHCFPWSRWNNNDLWNLLPASHTANAAKSEKLPADSLLKQARPRVIEWWEHAIIGTEREQFFSEAEAALPLLGRLRSTAYLKGCCNGAAVEDQSAVGGWLGV